MVCHTLWCPSVCVGLSLCIITLLDCLLNLLCYVSVDRSLYIGAINKNNCKPKYSKNLSLDIQGRGGSYSGVGSLDIL